MSSVRAVRLALAPRSLWPTVISAAFVTLVAWRWPEAFVVVGGVPGGLDGRVLGIFEMAPLAMTFTLGVGLAPRLMAWERFGVRRMGLLAFAMAGVIILLPVCGFFAVLQLYPSDGDPPARTLWPIAENVVVAGMALVILLGIVGRLGGSVAWLIGLYLAYWVPTRWSNLESFSPMTLLLRADGTLESGTRWPWLLGLGATSVAITWTRRLVPIDWVLRPAEEAD